VKIFYHLLIFIHVTASTTLVNDVTYYIMHRIVIINTTHSVWAKTFLGHQNKNGMILLVIVLLSLCYVHTLCIVKLRKKHQTIQENPHKLGLHSLTLHIVHRQSMCFAFPAITLDL